MVAWDPHHKHRIAVTELAAIAKAAKAGAHPDERPRNFAGEGANRPATPSPPDPGEGVRGDPQDIIRHVLELLQGGDVGKAVEVLEAFLKSPDQSEKASAKALLDLSAKALANLRRGPDNLEAIRRRFSEKDALRFVDSAVRRPSAERRLLRSIDRAVKGDDR